MNLLFQLNFRLCFHCYVINSLKGRVQCFSMQVVINKCFFLNPEKKLAQIRLVVFEKNAKIAQLQRIPIPKNDVTEPKTRLL